MRKITALIIATIMVALCFSVATTASAEDTNLLAGMSYTVGGDATPKDAGTAGADTTPGTLLTDGVVRDAAEMTSTGGPVAGKTLEYQGTYKTVTFTFEFDEAVSIATLVADGARGWDAVANSAGEAAPNRHCNFANIEVSTDGLNFTAVTYSVAKTVIEGSAQYGATAPADQFWTITATLDAVAENVSALRVTFDTTRDDGTNGYIVQLDELEAYGASAEAPVSSEEAPVSSEEAPVSSEDAATTEDATTEDATTEDATTTEDTTEDTTEEPSVPVADFTYTVTFTVEEDGTILMTVTAPAGTGSGKIYFNVSEDLVYVADSLTGAFGSANDNAQGAYLINCAVAELMEADTVIGSAKFTLAEGAELDASDLVILDWSIYGDETQGLLGSLEDGTVAIVLPEVEVDSSDDTTEDTTAEETTVDVSEPETPSTGDSGVAVFAVLALVSAAAVVVLKKRA